MSRRAAVSGLVAGALLAGSLGAAAGLALPDEAVGQAYLLVPPAPGNAYDRRTGNAYEDLATEAQLVRSDRVVDTVVDATAGAQTSEQVRTRTRVEIVPGAEVVLIRYRATDPATAADVAGALADAVVAERSRRSRAGLTTDEALVEPRAAAAREQFARAVQVEDGVGTVLLGNRLALLRAETARAQGAGGGEQGGSLLRVSAERTVPVVPVVVGGVGGAGLGLLAGALVLVRGRHRRQREDASAPATPAQDRPLETVLP